MVPTVAQAVVTATFFFITDHHSVNRTEAAPVANPLTSSSAPAAWTWSR